MAVQYKHTDEPTEKGVQINVEPTVYRRYQCRYKPHILILASLLVLLLILIVVWMIILLIKYESPNANNVLETLPQPATPTLPESTMPTLPTTNPNFDPKVNLTLHGKLKIVSRQEWLAQQPVEAATPLKLPVHYVIISHTATENCSNQASCTLHVRFIQTFHIENRNWWDIAYNFLVGGDGYVYEGRGWKSEGAHTYGYNSRSIGISFIGTFNQILPPQRQILAAKQLIQKGVELGHIAPDYKVLATRQLHTTQSPGLKLYEDIKTWPHWAENL